MNIGMEFMKTMMTFIAITLATAIMGQSADDVTGVWMVQDEDAYIKIFEKDGKYFGEVTWLKDPYDENGNPRTDPDGNKIKGMTIMKDFVFDEDEWVDGTVYDAEKGDTYHGSMKLQGNDKLKLRGSLDSFGLIGRTETWTRMQQR